MCTHICSAFEHFFSVFCLMKKYLFREKTRLILEKFRAVVPCKIQQISTFHPQLFTICSTNEAENLYNTRLGGKFWRNSTFSSSSQSISTASENEIERADRQTRKLRGIPTQTRLSAQFRLFIQLTNIQKRKTL